MLFSIFSSTDSEVGQVEILMTKQAIICEIIRSSNITKGNSPKDRNLPTLFICAKVL